MKSKHLQTGYRKHSSAPLIELVSPCCIVLYVGSKYGIERSTLPIGRCKWQVLGAQSAENLAGTGRSVPSDCLWRTGHQQQSSEKLREAAFGIRKSRPGRFAPRPSDFNFLPFPLSTSSLVSSQEATRRKGGRGQRVVPNDSEQSGKEVTQNSNGRGNLDMIELFNKA
eukprot:4054520-Amphidinium_carterae.1